MSDITSDRLDGRVALVTGSTRGIGSAIAERLAAAGATVIVHGRSTDRCTEVAAQIPGALPVAFDLTSADAGDRLVAAVVAKANRLDIVVNNAGVALDNFITGVTNDRWADTLTANLTAPFAIIRAAARVFKIQGERGNPGQAAYAASKGGLHAVTQTAARELGRFAVRVNSISPLAATEMNGLIDEDRREVVAKALPLGMVADPSQIAEAVAFLVSDRAAYITGELMHVDAGFHLT